MNESERDRIIELIVDSPDKLTDNDIQLIVNDNELRELYQTAISLKNSALTQQDVDIDAEWEIFNKRLTTKKTTTFHWRRAAVITGLIVAITTTATIFIGPNRLLSFFAQPEPEEMVEENLTNDETPTITVASTPVILSQEAIEFDNVPLAEIMARLGEVYSCKFDFANDSLRSIRLYLVVKPNQSLEDVVKILDTFDAFSVTLADNIVTIK